jgi:hypothetical protein
MQNDETRFKTYVWHGDECFFVSTIERDSSAMMDPPPRFHETLVWAYDYRLGVRLGDVLYYEGNGPAFKQHTEVVRQLFETGKYVQESDE